MTGHLGPIQESHGGYFVFLQRVSVTGCHTDGGVSQELLDGDHVYTGPYKAWSERVAQIVEANVPEPASFTARQ